MSLILKSIACVLSIAFLVGCQTSASDEDKTLTILYWQAPSLPSAYLSAGTKDVDAAAITLEPLATHDPSGRVVPVLAAEVPTIENLGFAQDLMSITWKLKSNLKWSDGSDVTADDVVFTWTYCTHEETGCTSENAFDGIVSVEAIDDLSVRIAFDAPNPYPYNAFVGAGSPIISKAQFSDCIGAAATTCQRQNTLPVGTGPYRITSFTPNEDARYERNPFYRGDEPYFDDVVLKGGGDALSAARAVLQEGEADYAWNLQISPEELEELQVAGDAKVVNAFSSLVERIVINHANPDPALGEERSEYMNGDNPHPFLSSKPIRQAMSMAIDRNLISERLYGFAARPTCNLVDGPEIYVSTANDSCLEQKIAEANELLDGNNVLDTDGDGIREYNGMPLRITFQTSTNSVRQETQNLIRDWWRQIGIETELIHHDASLFFGGDPLDDAEYTYRRFFADVQMYATGAGIDPQQHLSDMLCVYIPTREDNWSLGNISRACDPQYDSVFAELPSTPQGPERTRIIKQLNDIQVQGYHQLPLVNRGLVSAHLNTLRGVKSNGWDSSMWNIAEWHR